MNTPQQHILRVKGLKKYFPIRRGFLQRTSGWTIQPDFQYIWQPGGNVPAENGRGAVENAAVFGARTAISF